ncbi:MAG: NUDIX hydrolase, partial [Candidatus Methanomethylicia archaeon]
MTLKSRYVYRGKIINVRVDEFETVSKQYMKEIVEHPGAVAIIPILDSGKIIMIKQYRYAVKRELIEVPAGTIENGEKPEECAYRELIEETGYIAGEIFKIAEFYLAPGYSEEVLHLFIARKLVKGGAKPEIGEKIESVMAISLNEAIEMVRRGEIRDAKTICALYYL